MFTLRKLHFDTLFTQPFGICFCKSFKWSTSEMNHKFLILIFNFIIIVDYQKIWETLLHKKTRFFSCLELS